jgi:hypothetical protein
MAYTTLTGPVPGSAAAAAGLQPQTLEPGTVVQVGTNITAQAASSITPQTPVFALAAGHGTANKTLTVSAQGIGGLPTTVTAYLLGSWDGGLTWQPLSSALNLFATGAGAPQQVISLTAGPLYTLAISALTLGTLCTGVNLLVSQS